MPWNQKEDSLNPTRSYGFIEVQSHAKWDYGIPKESCKDFTLIKSASSGEQAVNNSIELYLRQTHQKKTM